MSSPARKQGSRRGAQILSSLLFLIAIGFAGSAVYIWQFQDEPDGNEAPIPGTPESGEDYTQVAQVIKAFTTAGHHCDYVRSPASAKSDQTGETPGQHITVDGQHVFVFIFTEDGKKTGAEVADQVMKDIDPATMKLSTPSGADPAEGQPLSVFQGKNIIVVTYGGDEESNADIQTVIEGLN